MDRLIFPIKTNLDQIFLVQFYFIFPNLDAQLSDE